jgi:hypothetical protein
MPTRSCARRRAPARRRLRRARAPRGG